MQESGLIEQLIRDVSSNGTICNLPPGQEEQLPPQALGMQQLWGLFVILFVGRSNISLLLLTCL